MANPDLFDVYFRRADTDRDGRISGLEAVNFFQGANLQREVLAKIWQYADQGQTGFLSRPEFYNALKLVTVAQTGRELTPAIVNRALHGPAASQIPAPQIQLTPGPPAPLQPAGIVRPVRPLSPVSSLPTQQYQQYSSGPTQPGQTLPSGPRPTAPAAQPRAPTFPSAGVPIASSAEWPNNKSSSWPGPASNNNLAGQNYQGKPSPIPTPQVAQGAFGGGSFQSGANSSVPKAPSSGSTGQAGTDLFGGDVFTAVPTKPLSSPAQPQPTLIGGVQGPQPRTTQTAAGTEPTSLALVPTTVAPAPPPKPIQPVAVPAGHARPDSRETLSGFWPKITEAIVRRYTKIFIEVDTDKDGKITGVEARNLFLSWHLPREVLKQIWDLSDQDQDSMLSLREFCTALYLMERHREGRMLPATIPTAGIYFDESGVQALRIAEAHVAVAQNSAGFNVPAWQQNPSVLQATGHVMPGLPPRPAPPGPVPVQVPPGQKLSHIQAPVRGPLQPPGSEGFGISHMAQQKSRAPVLEMHLVNQLNADDQLKLQTKHQEAVDAENKVQELEKEIMDSKEKMEFYRTKLQDIVLFKTRCDNRLAEITERAAADKREVESFANRYDEKFKQAGESQSRLLIDEAAFRDIQERRLELYNAIVRMEQGGDSNALLQSRADRLQGDLDELRKALNAKSKQFGLRVKPMSLIELPYGWQPGVQENAAHWDEDWDKFDDEGFVFVQEFMDEGTPANVAGRPNAVSSWEDNGEIEDGFDFSSADAEEKSQVEDSLSGGHLGSSSPKAESDDGVFRNGDMSSHHEMSPRSPGHPGMNAPDKDLQSHERGPSLSHSADDASADTGEDWASVFSHKSENADLSGQGSWEMNNSPRNKAPLDTFFQSGKPNSPGPFGFRDSFDMLASPARGKDGQEDFPSLGPIRTKDTAAFSFDNSVPSTPLYNNTSPAHASSFDHQFRGREQFVRFDSFSSNITDSGHPTDNFARFDSFSSVRDAPQSRGFTSFDDSDPFAGTGPFGSGQTPKRNTDTWSAFS